MYYYLVLIVHALHRILCAVTVSECRIVDYTLIYRYPEMYTEHFTL